MSGKRKYIIWAVIVALSSSIFTWLFLYSNFPQRSPMGAKQVFYLNKVESIHLTC
jgi:hypothetical protein